jgi:hypothetical protein
VNFVIVRGSSFPRDLLSDPEAATVEVPMRKFVVPSLIVLAVLIYGNTLHAPFVFDDIHTVVERPDIREVSHFLSFRRLLQPRALVDLTFALNYRAGGLDVAGYHLLNTLIHGLNGVLVFFLARIIFRVLSAEEKTGSPRIAAFLTAAIFVAHPVQTQAVTYVVQRYTSMAATFYLASILFYLRARRIQQDRGRWAVFTGLFGISILCGLAAFLSKQHAASLPFALLLVEYTIVDRSLKGWEKRLPFLAAASLIWCLFVLYVLGLFRAGIGSGGLLEDVSRISRDIEQVGRWQYLCTQFNVLVIYIRLLFLPLNQCLDYAYPFKKGFFDGLTPLAALSITGLLSLGLATIKRAPVVALSIFWFFI